ncbi:MAG: hypothetical protein KGI49_01485 [Patescibacteria group bacterium]|nr:hypothetical protein [Patescibacteria group bacterium]
MKSRTISAIAVTIGAIAIAVPVFAQVGVGASINASVNPGGPMLRADMNASTTGGGRVFRGRGTAGASSTVQVRIQNGQNRGQNEITARISNLNKLLTRIQSMRNLSSGEQASLSAEIQAEITAMSALQTKIQGDVSTTSLQSDLRSIAPDFRIYMLIEPQISLLSAVDRINTLISDFRTIQSKIQARVSGDASLSSNTTITADMSDMTAKLSDASAKASDAENEIVGLKPDQGVQTTMQSNLATLKDARGKIHAAQQDLVAARKDAGDAVKLIIGSDRGLMTSTSATTSTSASTSVNSH